LDITPKCRYGDTLFVTPFGTLRPCCWVPEQMCWKTFDIDPNWNMDMTPVKTIKEKTVLDFANKMEQQPMDICKRMCSSPNDTSLFNATQKMVVDDGT